MLWISSTKRGPGVTLDLRGQIVEPWIDLLREESEAILRENRPLELDLGRVTLVSVRGLELLRRLAERGASLTGSSLIEEMLEGIEPSGERGKRP